MEGLGFVFRKSRRHGAVRPTDHAHRAPVYTAQAQQRRVQGPIAEGARTLVASRPLHTMAAVGNTMTANGNRMGAVVYRMTTESRREQVGQRSA